jgi:hypothetical protein
MATDLLSHAIQAVRPLENSLHDYFQQSNALKIFCGNLHAAQKQYYGLLYEPDPQNPFPALMLPPGPIPALPLNFEDQPGNVRQYLLAEVGTKVDLWKLKKDDYDAQLLASQQL